MTQATVSYHLKVLKKADLIRENRKKNFIYYELNLTVLEELMMWLSDLKGKVSMKDNNTDYQNDNSCNNSNISLSMAVISVIATLLPIIIGLALWNKLPDELPVHWGIKGNVDRLATKAEGIFIMPCLCAIIQIGVLIKLYIDPRKEQIHHKPVLVSIWIVPLITILINVLIYIIALGGKVSMTMAVFFIIGVMFIGLGNYMPKLKQNYTIGIKVPWTLNSEENWNMTHRMAGKVYVVAGVISIIIALLNNVLSDEVTIIIFMAVFLVTGIGSVAYSFWLYKVKGL